MNYFLNIDSFDCSFHLFINDIPVLDMRRGGNLNTDISINKFIVNGSNEIRCFIKPFPSVEKIPATAYVKFVVYTETTPKDKRNEIRQIKTPEFKELKESPLPKDFILSDNFKGDNLKDDVIQNGIIFKDTPELRKEILDMYNLIWDYFKNKNLIAIKDIFYSRNKQLAMLLNKDEAVFIKESEDDYSNYMNNNELELWKMNLEKMDFKLYFNNKLACYELKNGNSPICFVNNIEKYVVYIPLYFNRNPLTKKLEIIR